MGRMVPAAALTVAAVVLALAFVHAAGSPAQRVKIAAKEFAFVPDAVTLAPGVVRFEIQNTGAIEHTFVITGMDKAKTKGIVPGGAEALEVTLRPGSYEVICDIPGHKDAGMVMRVTVK
ncbi:MAG: cupredoxin domain-containing protein [Armatimonadetes bacterium]|nr:cupredoxin domain-containing protein [Armatimonadota bacterium]